MEYIAALIDVVPTAANIDYHARIVRDKAVLRGSSRRHRHHPGHLRGPRYRGECDKEHRVFQVANSGHRGVHPDQGADLPTMERIEQLQSGAGALTGVPERIRRSGSLHGWLPARRSRHHRRASIHGQDGARVEHRAARRDRAQTGVACFSLEMSKDQLVQRLLCSEGLSRCPAAAARPAPRR